MTPSINFFNLVKASEGFRSYPYLDNKQGKIATIGYGTTKYPNGNKVTLKDKPITLADAESYLLNDIKWAIKAIKDHIKVELNQNQFDALLDLVYNLGETQFKHSTLLKFINERASTQEITAQFKRWIYDNGIKLNGLVARRDNEIKLFFKEC